MVSGVQRSGGPPGQFDYCYGSARAAALACRPFQSSSGSWVTAAWFGSNRMRLNRRYDENAGRQSRINIWSSDFDTPWDWRATTRNR
jgi:hypothetical protein